MATYGMDVKLQKSILKGLAANYYPRIRQLGAQEVVVRPSAISNPVRVAQGVWQVVMSAGRFFYDGNGALLASDPYNARITVREVEPPLKPLGAITAFDDLVFQSRQSGLEIADIQLIQDESDLTKPQR
jgi:hypothetical protein